MKILELNKRYYELQNTFMCKDFNILHYKKWEIDPRESTAHGTSIFFVTKKDSKEFEKNANNFAKYDGIYSVFEFEETGAMARRGHHWISGYVNYYFPHTKHMLVVRVPRRFLEEGYKMFIDELKVYGKHMLDNNKL